MPPQPAFVDLQDAQGRPKFADLFAHKICDSGQDPYGAKSQHYANWAPDHKNSKRFYVKGWPAVQGLIGQFANKPYFDVTDAALVLAGRDADWKRYTVNISPHRFSEQQVGRVTNMRPVTYDRAGLIILAAEYMYRVEGHTDLRPLYAPLSLLPACYIIDKYNKVLWEKHINGQKLAATILSDAGQDKDKLLEDMAVGMCVTLKTAQKVKASFEQHTGVELGTVRPYPILQREQQTGSASENENVAQFNEG